MTKPTRPVILKRIIGIIFIIIGLFALLTPFTPGSWLIFVGLGLIGVRILFKEKLRSLYKIIKETIFN